MFNSTTPQESVSPKKKLNYCRMASVGSLTSLVVFIALLLYFDYLSHKNFGKHKSFSNKFFISALTLIPLSSGLFFSIVTELLCRAFIPTEDTLNLRSSFGEYDRKPFKINETLSGPGGPGTSPTTPNSSNGDLVSLDEDRTIGREGKIIKINIEKTSQEYLEVYFNSLANQEETGKSFLNPNVSP